MQETTNLFLGLDVRERTVFNLVGHFLDGLNVSAVKKDFSVAQNNGCCASFCGVIREIGDIGFEFDVLLLGLCDNRRFGFNRSREECGHGERNPSTGHVFWYLNGVHKCTGGMTTQMRTYFDTLFGFPTLSCVLELA